MKKVKYVLLILSFYLFTITCFAQGDGPRSELFAPTGVWGVNPKYLHLEQNLLPAGNILVEGANFKIDVFPTTFFHTFGIGNNYARVLAMVNPGSGKATADINPQIPVPIDELSFNGFSDGFVAFEVGILNTPAVNVVEFTKLEPEIRVTGQFRLWYSGSYDSSKIVNLGTNRFALEFRSTLLIPLFKSLEQKQTWIEFVPKLQVFTDNNDPARSSTASKIEQDPFFMIESHLSHNFTKRLWASLDLGYQYGGNTAADGVSDDNTINFMGGGASLGYQILPYLGAYSSYGTDFFNSETAVNAEMIRFSVVFTYVNIKKLNKQTN
jgi:hypothetical protein